MSERFKDFDPAIGSRKQGPATNLKRTMNTHADLGELRDALRELVSFVDTMQDELEKELSLVALPVGDFDPVLVQAHKKEWPEAAGPRPSSVGYRYYKALKFKDTTSANYIRKRFEEAARDVAGTPALDLYELADLARDEALLIEAFLDRHIGSTHDSAERRVLEVLQEWVQAALVQTKKLHSYYESGPRQYLSEDELKKTSKADAKSGQAVFKVKLNNMNSDIEKDIDTLKRNFSEFAPVFYEKFLGPALDFQLKVGRVTKPSSGDVNSEVVVSSAYLGENLKTAIADQTRRKITYKTKIDKIAQNIQTRDKYRSLINELSEKGKPIPTSGPRTLIPSEQTPEEVVYWASDYARNHVPNQPNSVQRTTSGSVGASHTSLDDLGADSHPQYLLRSGGNVTGDITFGPDATIDEMVPSTHKHTGEDGTMRIHGSDIVGGSLDDDVVDTTKKPTAPFNLRITSFNHSIVPPGVTLIDATLTWDGNPELSHEIQMTRI